jgi:hypothetical protein
MPGQNVLDTAFERVPPEFRRTGRSREYNRHTDINTPHPFDEISPIAIGQGELRDNHGLLARRVEQINSCPYAARPLHNQSVGFDVLQDRGFRSDTKITVPACLSVCIDPLTLPDSTLSPLGFDWP